MSNAKPKRYVARLSYYLRRYGSRAYDFKWPLDYITPKQRRRLFHKAGHHDRMVEQRMLHPSRDRLE